MSFSFSAATLYLGSPIQRTWKQRVARSSRRSNSFVPLGLEPGSALARGAYRRKRCNAASVNVAAECSIHGFLADLIRVEFTFRSETYGREEVSFRLLGGNVACFRYFPSRNASRLPRRIAKWKSCQLLLHRDFPSLAGYTVAGAQRGWFQKRETKSIFESRAPEAGKDGGKGPN